MFTKYKQLILSMFVLICCLTDTTQAKSYIKLSDQYSPHCVVLDHHYKHLSRHALRKTTLAMHRAHQKALGACKRAYYHSIKHYEARTCPQAEYRVQQHELLKNLAQLQAQCAFSQEQTARTLQATQQALQLQQESTAAIINQLKEKLASMQQQYTTLEQKYRRLEELTKERQELPLEKELQQEPQDVQDTQELEQNTLQAQEQQQNQQNSAQELPELQEPQKQQPDSTEQQAALEELLGKKRAARESQSHAQAPILESKEPQPELESALQPESDDTNSQEPVQQQQTLNNAQDQTNQQEVEVLVPEEEVSGKSTANNNDDQNDQDDEDAAFEQRLLNLLQEKQETIKTLTQELERERTQARTTIAHLQQELTNHQTALKEALEVLTTGEQPQQQRAEQAAAGIERILQRAPEQQQELEPYQTTLADVLNLYDQQATEKKTLQQNLTQAQKYIDQQKIQEKHVQEALHETKKELVDTNKQLTRALFGFDSEHKQRQALENHYKTLAAKPNKSVVNQETQTDAQIQAIEQSIVQEPGETVHVGCVSLTSVPRIDSNGEMLYTDYTLTVTVDGKTIIMNTHDSLEQNKQATDELIAALENISEEKFTEIQNYLQEAFSNFSLIEQIKFLRPLFYMSRPLQCPHPILALLITPSLTSLLETALAKRIDLGIHQCKLEKMLNANRACLDNMINMNNQSPQDSDQNLSDEENIQDQVSHPAQPEQIIEVPQEPEQTEALAQESQRAWYNPLRWFGR